MKKSLSNLLYIIPLLIIISCKSKEHELTEYLQVMKVNNKIEGPKRISNEITIDSINVEVYPKPYKFINYVSFNSEIVNSIGLENLLNNYKNYAIKDIKEFNEYKLFKENDLTLEYNIYVDQKFSSKITINSNEY